MGYLKSQIKHIRTAGKRMVNSRKRKRVGHGRKGKKARRLMSVRKRR